jgi:hypothetical protein
MTFINFYTWFSRNKWPSALYPLAVNEIRNNIHMLDDHLFNTSLLVYLVNKHLQRVAFSVIMYSCLSCIYCAVEYLI